MLKKVRNDLSRIEYQQKLKEAHGKNPIKNITEMKNKFIKERLIRISKKRKRFNRPVLQTLEADWQTDSIIHRIKFLDYPTPQWFTKTTKADVSVIIPIYKSKEVLFDLIKSWPLDEKLNVEVIFVEDCCPDNCKEMVVKAWNSRKKEIKKPIGRIIQNKKNGGYGAACNVGASVATGDFLIFLNADTEVTKGWIEPMIDLFSNPKVGMVANLHLKRGGGWNGFIESAGSEWRWGDNSSFVHIGRHSFRKKGIASPFSMENAPKEILQDREIEMATGCCFAMKKSLFDYIGGFNLNYKIGYWEDSELCMNVRELGYTIMFTPKSVIFHKLGHTNSGGHKFFNHNREFFKNKWIKSGRLHALLIPPEKPAQIESILIKRMNATGDVLVAAGVCAALKKKHPDVKIAFWTKFPEIVAKNPYIDQIVESFVKTDVFYNLDLAYEWRPEVNILTSYAEACGVKKEDCIVYLSKKKYTAKELPNEFIIIHPGKTNWAGRDWPHENFVELSKKLLYRGEKIVCVGHHSEEEIPCTLDLRGETNIAELAWIMSKAKLFIGIDSFPMHVAQVANIPAIAFFGCIKPELRIYNKKLVGITAMNLDCLGCHHRKPAPSTVTNTCETGTFDCIKKVSVLDMLNLVKSTLKDKNDLISLVG